MCIDHRLSHARHLSLEIVSTHGLALSEMAPSLEIPMTPRRAATPKTQELASSFNLLGPARNGHSELRKNGSNYEDMSQSFYFYTSQRAFSHQLGYVISRCTTPVNSALTVKQRPCKIRHAQLRRKKCGIAFFVHLSRLRFLVLHPHSNRRRRISPRGSYPHRSWTPLSPSWPNCSKQKYKQPGPPSRKEIKTPT